MTKSQLKFHEKTKVRDLALLTLLLGTGFRVSECVGLDLNDVDFDNMAIRVRRKGGYEDVVYFEGKWNRRCSPIWNSENMPSPLKAMRRHSSLPSESPHGGAQRGKSGKKIRFSGDTTKKITPHKLRSTYGTTLYQETGDIYLVADVLGIKTSTPPGNTTPP